jgi:phosphomannomutase
LTIPESLKAAVKAWVAEDPDPATRAELEALLADASPAARTELADRFAGRLRFGTAGLRGAMAAGPNRMNRAMVRMATAALAQWLEQRPANRALGVVVGCDARHGSTHFADEAVGILTGAGFRVYLLEKERPTPLVPFAVRFLGAAAGLMITASHNPAGDNGYKLYLADGAQIIPPVDAEIEARMDSVGPLTGLPIGDVTGALVTRPGAGIEAAYVDSLVAVLPAPLGGPALRVVYTPLHGVALGLFRAALRQAGFPDPVVVAAQARPDPDFPTVPFPNPEEPGALDLAISEARRIRADVVIANDPDGDRLAVAVPDVESAGGWRVLTGDQVGALMGAYLLDRTAAQPDPGSRLVASTIVSSSLLAKISAVAGVHYAETLTGFKWIVRAGERLPGSRFLFGYEEALGYSVGTVVRDKDGIGAALTFLRLTADALGGGRNVLDLLDALEARHGVHLTAQITLRSADPAAALARLREIPAAAISGRRIAATVDLATDSLTGPDLAEPDLPRSDLLIYRLDGARIALRPSGTEPKLKVYVEVVRAVAAAGLAEARRAAAVEMRALCEGVAALLGA